MLNRSVEEALKALSKSTFRARFKLRTAEFAYIADKGLDTIARHARDFICSRIAPAFPKNDGRQTPMKNHPVFIAQHATATCCRGCLQKWHKIPRGRALKGSEIDYIEGLIMVWIGKQLGRRRDGC